MMVDTETYHSGTSSLQDQLPSCGRRGQQATTAARPTESASAAESLFGKGHTIPGAACIQSLREVGHKDPDISAHCGETLMGYSL